MAGDSPGGSADPLEEIAYLARSANRVRLLRTLVSEPYTRGELNDLTGVSRTTVGRIVNEFERRGWVERTDDGTYVTTPTGTLVVREFIPLLEAMRTIQTLGHRAAWIPVAELPIGLEHFGDATVRQGEPNAPLAFVDYLTGLIREATTFRVLTFLAPPSSAWDAMTDGVREGRLSAEHVLAGGLVDHLRDRRQSATAWREYIEAGAVVYRYAGHIPCNLFIVDETVLVMSDRPEGGGAAIESDDATVRAAFHDLFETYRDDAEPVDVDRL